MKRSKIYLYFCVLLIVFSASPQWACAGDYLGQFCWNYTNTTFESSGIVTGSGPM
jgi:hypothetical protein